MTNNTGSYANETPVTTITHQKLVNISATKNSLSAGRICGKFWFNDTSNNANMTTESCIVIYAEPTDTIYPTHNGFYNNNTINNT